MKKIDTKSHLELAEIIEKYGKAFSSWKWLLRLIIISVFSFCMLWEKILVNVSILKELMNISKFFFK